MCTLLFLFPSHRSTKKTFLSVYILKSTVEGFRECCFYVSRTKLQELLKKFGDLCVYTANRIADIRWFKPQGPRTIFGTNDSPVFIYPLHYSSSQHQVSHIIQFRRAELSVWLIWSLLHSLSDWIYPNFWKTAVKMVRPLNANSFRLHLTFPKQIPAIYYDIILSVFQWKTGVIL